MTILTVPSTTDFSGQTLNDIEKIDFTNGLLDFVATATFSAGQFKGAPPQIRSNVLIEGSGGAVVNAFINRIIVNGGSLDASGWQFSNWFSNDTITLNGDDLNNTIRGTSQADTINGGIGIDAITGGQGADVLNGGNGSDIFRFAANDIAVGEVIDGGQGTADALVVSGSVNLGNALVTGVERLTFDSGAGVVAVSTANVTQFGVGGITTISGGTGTDILSITGAVVDVSSLTFSSWGVTDEIRLFGTSSNDTITGSDRNDRISGGLGNDVLSGGAGNDVFVYGPFGEEGTAETVDGGAGTADRILITSASAYNFSFLGNLTGVEIFDFGVHAGLNNANFNGSQLGGSGIRRVEGNANATDVLRVDGTFVNLSGVSFLNWTDGVDGISISGNAAAESSLIGSREDDVITGGSLDDVLQGHAGADFLTGGDGIDTASYGLSGAVVVDLKANTASGSHAEGDIFLAIENLLGSDFGDSLTGDDNDNRLTGGDGADTLRGGIGIDSLFGGEGNDSFVFRASDEVSVGEIVRGGNGTVDKIVIAADSSPRIELDKISILDVERLVFDSSGLGSIGFVRLDDGQIGAGVRSIMSVQGSLEADRLDVIGRNIDLSQVSFSNWSPNDSVFLTGDTHLSSTLVGSNQSDRLIGSNANDTIDGGAGDDDIKSGLGRDVMTGGTGDDVFDFVTSGDSIVGPDRDVIKDFTVAAGNGAEFIDRIDLNLLFESDPTSFINSDAFTAEGQVRAIQSGANTLIQVNLVGTSGAEMEILLQNFTATNLTRDDFIF